MINHEVETLRDLFAFYFPQEPSPEERTFKWWLRLGGNDVEPVLRKLEDVAKRHAKQPLSRPEYFMSGCMKRHFAEFVEPTQN